MFDFLHSFSLLYLHDFLFLNCSNKYSIVDTKYQRFFAKFSELAVFEKFSLIQKINRICTEDIY